MNQSQKPQIPKQKTPPPSKGQPSDEETIIKNTIKNTFLIGIFLFLFCTLLALQITNYASYSQEQQSKLLTLKNQNQDTSVLKQDYNAVKKEAEIINASLPNKENIIDLVSSLETIALENNFKAQLSFEKSQPQKDKQGFTLIPFKMLFTGNIQDLISYLYQLEKLPYFVKISKITSQNLKGLKSEGQYFLDANLYIFQ
jgi:Tfp pilus assembly protein PilO